jgi:hypothetical protein
MNCYHWNGFSHIARRRRAAVVSTYGGANGDNIIVCHIIIIIIIISCYIQCRTAAAFINIVKDGLLTKAFGAAKVRNSAVMVGRSNVTDNIPLMIVFGCSFR